MIYTKNLVNIGYDINYYKEIYGTKYNILNYVVDYGLIKYNKYNNLVKYITFLTDIYNFTKVNLKIFVEYLYINSDCSITIEYRGIKQYIENKYNIVFNNGKISTGMRDNKKYIINDENDLNDVKLYNKVLLSIQS
jgi:hypothetical protein